MPYERIDKYNNPHLIQELKKAHINGTLFPETNTPVSESLFPDPDTTGAVDTPVSHNPDIENSAEECIKEG